MKNLILFLLLSSVLYSARAMEQEQDDHKDDYTIIRRMIPIESMHPNIAQWKSEFREIILRTNGSSLFFTSIKDYMMTNAENYEYFRMQIITNSLEHESELYSIKTCNMLLNAWIAFKSYNPRVEWTIFWSTELKAALERYREFINGKRSLY